MIGELIKASDSKGPGGTVTKWDLKWIRMNLISVKVKTSQEKQDTLERNRNFDS